MADLLHVMNHHARDKAEIINAISLMFTTVLSQQGWRSINTRGGASSWKFYHEKTRKELHFRHGGKGKIRVYDTWHYKSTNRPPVAILASRVDVYRWAKTLKP